MNNISTVITAYLPFLDSYQNHSRHCELLQALDKLGKPYSGVRITREGKTVSAFVVSVKPEKLLDMAKKLGQTTLLVIEDGLFAEFVVKTKDLLALPEKLVRTTEKNAIIITENGTWGISSAKELVNERAV